MASVDEPHRILIDEAEKPSRKIQVVQHASAIRWKLRGNRPDEFTAVGELDLHAQRAGRLDAIEIAHRQHGTHGYGNDLALGQEYGLVLRGEREEGLVPIERIFRRLGSGMKQRERLEMEKTDERAASQFRSLA